MVLGERQVEIPWLAKFVEGIKVPSNCLDVGSAGADYIDIFNRFDLTRLDQFKIEDNRCKVVVEDIRLFHGHFDLVMLISSLEHIGLDAYGFKANCSDPVSEQKRTFEHCYSLVNPNGYLIMTLPFGIFEDGGWYLTYNSKMIDDLIDDKFVVEEVYFTLEPSSWTYHKVPRYKCPLRGQDWVRSDFSRATSICCLVLQKTERKMYGTKVNLGCGGAILEGFTNVDLNPINDNVIKMDFFTYMKRCPSNSVEHISMSHSIEHLSLAAVLGFLMECHRSLKPNGFLEIVCPDGDWFINKYISGEIDNKSLHAHMYGNKLNENDFHLWSPMLSNIKNLISDAGFTDVKYYTGDSNIGIHCRK